MPEWGTEMEFIADWRIPRGEPLVWGNTFLVHPSDWLLQQGKGRFPFETRHCAGAIEAERDRRRYGCPG